MILDNFSFITDGVAQVETPDWSTGASSEQVLELADAFRKYDAKSGYVSISCLNSLMCTMHQPLGFRNQDDHIEFDERDRVSHLLVRAELNVIRKHEYQKEAQWRARAWYRRFRLPKIEHKKKFEMWVSFDDVMYTLLYWRQPQMVPRVLKYQRAEKRIQETIVMAQKLIITDFFRALVAERMHYDMAGKLQERSAMRLWSSIDIARQRRIVHTATKTSKLKDFADKKQLAHDSLYVPPSKFCSAIFVHSDEMPDNVISQVIAVRSLLLLPCRIL